MRKVVIIAAALFIGSFTANATSLPVDHTEINTVDNAEFQPIEVKEIPVAVIKALNTDFPDAKLSKAYTNQLGTYKLDVKISGMNGILLASQNGDWIL